MPNALVFASDLEGVLLGCGGTLAKLANEDYSISCLLVNDSKAIISEVMTDAACRVGIIMITHASESQIVEIIKKSRPRIVITQHELENTVKATCNYASGVKLCVSYEAIRSNCKAEYMMLVDVTNTMFIKESAIKTLNIDESSVRLMQNVASIRGLELEKPFGVGYAEAFHILKYRDIV